MSQSACAHRNGGPQDTVAAAATTRPARSTAGDPGALSIEMLFHPTQRRPIIAGPRTQLDWLADGVLQETRRRQTRDGAAMEFLRVDPAAGTSSPLLDGARVEGALVKAGAPEADARAALGGGGLVWNDARSGFAIAIADDLFYVDLMTGAGRRLTKEAGSEEEPTFSPDGSTLAFLRGNELWVTRVADGVETKLTEGASETRLNGKLDWVYQEELYGRGNWKGFWWSPDSKSIAYISLDETRVPTFTVLDHKPLHQEAHIAAYPKVGDPNPIVKLGIVGAAGGATRWMTDPHDGEEILIANVGWSPDGRLLAQWQNRAQTWLELVAFGGDGRASVVVKETSPAWVERSDMPRWLKSGGFLWESDRDGFHHIYQYQADGKLVGPVTAGKWSVTEVHGVDEAKGLLYFSAKERNPVGADAYRITLDGKTLTRLTEQSGTHHVRFSPDFTRFLDTWTDISTPPQQSLRDGDGKLVRLIDANASPAWDAVRKGKVTFQRVPTRDGVMMESMLVLPPDFDAAKKYPVMTFLYGGPNTANIHDAISSAMLFNHLLAQEGYVVWVCDNRSASGKGWGQTWGIFKNFGEQELADQLDGLAWLKKNPWVDASRIGIHGWSYGGYMTLVALTHCTDYKMGIAGAPVTDWRLYDSIYTERYMGLLQENLAGYKKASPITYANNLSGKLLILHGTMDDNVHPQNTMRFVDTLYSGGGSCELMMLPGSDHSPRAPGNRWAQYKSIYDFIKRNL